MLGRFWINFRLKCVQMVARMVARTVATWPGMVRCDSRLSYVQMVARTVAMFRCNFWLLGVEMVTRKVSVTVVAKHNARCKRVRDPAMVMIVGSRHFVQRGQEVSRQTLPYD